MSTEKNGFMVFYEVQAKLMSRAQNRMNNWFLKRVGKLHVKLYATDEFNI